MAGDSERGLDCAYVISDSTFERDRKETREDICDCPRCLRRDRKRKRVESAWLREGANLAREKRHV